MPDEQGLLFFESKTIQQKQRIENPRQRTMAIPGVQHRCPECDAEIREHEEKIKQTKLNRQNNER